MKQNTCVFLGAGASCQFGYPSTAELLPKTLQGLKTCKLFRGINDIAIENKDMSYLMEVLKQLMPGLSALKKFDSLPLITEVLSLVDYSVAERKSLFPNQTYEDVIRVRRLLDRAIYEVLWKQDGEISTFKHLHKRFCDWIIDNISGGGGLITTNYDTCFEQQLFDHLSGHVHNKFDFGFNWLDAEEDERVVRLRPKNPWLRWFKLHGSLNWARCPNCEHIFINPYGKIAHQPFKTKTDYDNTCYCGNKSRLELNLVAPSMYRMVRDANLLEVWKNSLQLLIESNHWIFIGYSLPSEDIAIRSMIVRAYNARGAKRPDVTIVQRSKKSKSQYKLLFPNCDYYSKGLESWLSKK